jgi:hypothetical protein
VYQPLIYLVEVEYMATWQNPYFVTFDKIGQADSTFNLSLKPGSKTRIRIRTGRGRVIGCPVWILAIMERRRLAMYNAFLQIGLWRQWCILSDLLPSFMFLPTGTGPNKPREIPNDIFWSSIALGSTSGSYTMN